MKVSVILPVVDKYMDYHEDARDSIRWQTVDVHLVEFTSSMNPAKATNMGAKEAPTEYIMRLDCDDMLHPMACEIMSDYLDRHPNTAAVYSDYWEIGPNNEMGPVISGNTSAPHPGCMMIRKAAFENIGGFNETLERQEGTDFYFRLSDKYNVDHINLPLWYYRRHDQQMSNAHNEVIKARHNVKETHKVESEKILAIIPARGGSKGIPRKNLVELNGLPLVSHAIRMAKSSKHDILIMVSTEDSEIERVALKEGVSVLHRDPADAEDDVNLITVAKHSMEMCDPDFRADIVITIQPTAPYTPVSALDNALDRMVADKELDAVVSMSELHGKHPWRVYQHVSGNNYAPFFPAVAETFAQRQDRPMAYQFTGGFYIRRRKLLVEWNGHDFALGNWEGELVPQRAGIDIDTRFDLWLAEAMLKHEDDT